METLLFHSRQQFTFTVIDKLQLGEEKISSTLIRHIFVKAKWRFSLNLLGRYYQTSGRLYMVRKGEERLVFQLQMWNVTDDIILPPTGVYAVKLTVDEN